MSEKNFSILPDVINSTSEAIQKNMPETNAQVDGALSTVVGFFNQVVLYPVKKANLIFGHKLEEFENDLKKKIKHIPNENLQVPPTMIAGPTLEALRYTYDEKELREMYENLLASSMDNRKVSEVHPSFVDAIKQMSSLDALVLSKIIDKGRNLACAEIRFARINSSEYYVNAMPDYFAEELFPLDDPFAVSSSLTNLQRLGLINISEGKLKSFDYASLISHSYVIPKRYI